MLEWCFFKILAWATHLLGFILLFSCSVVSDSLRPHGLQHTRHPCPLPSPEASSNSCPLSRWCHTTISSPSPPAFYLSQHQDLFLSQFFSSSGQNIGASASAPILPMNIQGLFPLGLTGLISLQSKGLSRDFFNTTVQNHQFFGAQPSYGPTLTSICNYGKTIALTRQTDLCWQSNILLSNILSRFVTAFLPRSKRLLISWLQSPSAVILEPKKIKFVTVSPVSPSICHEVMWPDAMILVFWMLSFKPAFSLSSFTFIKRLFNSSLLSATSIVSSAYLRLLIFLPQSWFQLVLHPAQRFSWCTLHIN